MITTLILAAAIATPCEVDGTKADCGTLTVLENRAVAGGRTIDLSYAVLAATPGKKSAHAVFALAGGPGQAASALGGFVSRMFAGSGIDVVLADARGTGKSNPLHCDFGGSEEDLAGYFNDMLPVDRIKACKTKLAANADLTQYTTRVIAEDLEAVRAHLGYDAIDLYGTSYGTRVALEMMRHHPKHVRSVILDGVVPPSGASPSWFAASGQRSLDGVFALCRADESCNTAYPNLAADYAKMQKAIANGIELDVEHPESKKKARVKISRGFFGEVFRNFLYSPESYARVPKAIHAASKGDWSIIGALASRYAVGIRTLDFGMFLSVTCTEDIPRIDQKSALAAAKPTFLGPYRVEQQLAACTQWTRGVADPLASKPVTSAIPTLLISGELDPVTPPSFGDEVMRTLSNAKHVVVPSGSHSGDTGGCLEKIAAEFVREGSVAALETSCVEKVKRPAFER